MYVEHTTLIEEMGKISQMSVDQRRNLAKKHRRDQVRHFEVKLKEWESNPPVRSTKPKISFCDKVIFLEASSRNDYNEIKRLLNAGANPDTKNDDGLTAMHQACIDGNDAILLLLIKYGANVNAADNEKWTPLHAAVACNQIKLVKLLVSKGAELLALNIDGCLAIDLADDQDMVRLLENEMENKGYTQLNIDNARSKLERIMLADMKKIVSKKGNLEYLDSSFATPLHIAAANGYMSVCEFLLQNDVNVNSLDKDNWTPAHAASYWSHIEILQLLLNYGADLKIKNNNRETVIDICEEPEIREQILRLKKHGTVAPRPSPTTSTPGRRSRVSTINKKVVSRLTPSQAPSITRRDTASELQIKLAAEERLGDNFTKLIRWRRKK